MKIKEFDRLQKKEENNNKTIYLNPIVDIFPVIDCNHQIIIAGLDKEPSFLVEIEKYDLETKEFWGLVHQFFSVNLVKVAKWWKKNFEELEPAGFFLSRNWSLNYKTKNEWEEWTALGENSQKLYDIYEFPISIMRLWDRLDSEIQELWLRILWLYPIKKNLLKEIIQDLYDLPLDVQKKVSLSSWEWTKKFIEHPKKGKRFPQEEIRDLIKQYRYPLSSGRRKQSYLLKKKIQSSMGLKNIEIQIPEDLESSPVRLTISLQSPDDFLKFLQSLENPKTKEYLLQLLQLIYEE